MESLKIENCDASRPTNRETVRSPVSSTHLPGAFPHPVAVVENDPKESNREDDCNHQQNQADAVVFWPAAGKIEDFLFHIRAGSNR